jgi:hypothetical protein
LKWKPKSTRIGILDRLDGWKQHNEIILVEPFGGTFASADLFGADEVS